MGTEDSPIKLAYFEHGVASATDELSDQILSWVREADAEGGVVGLSGGIDSTTVAYLCAYAFERHNATNLSSFFLNGLILPSEVNDDDDEQDALAVASHLGIESKVIPIQPIVQSFQEQIPEALQGCYHLGNLFSETRAVVLSRYAAFLNRIVMGTGNWDEDYVLGYFTKRGDGAVDNNILGNLPKRLVKELAIHLGVHESTVHRIPTAGLWEGQTDENELGYSYGQVEIIQNGFDQGFSTEQIVSNLF